VGTSGGGETDGRHGRLEDAHPAGSVAAIGSAAVMIDDEDSVTGSRRGSEGLGAPAGP